MILFSKSETLVLPYDVDEIRLRLSAAVKLVDRMHPPAFAGLQTNYLFYGKIESSSFRISEALKAPQNFLPQISGTIEPTSKGSIVLLKYRLFYSSRLFLGFWIVVCFLLALFFWLAYEQYLYAALAVFFAAANYAIAWANFRVHTRRSRQALMKIFEPGMEAGPPGKYTER